MTPLIKPVKIIIAEDHQLFALGMERLLNEEPDKYQVIAKAYNGKQLLEILPGNLPDLLLLDISMPITNGIDAALQVKKQYSQIKVIFLSMDNSPSLIKQLKAYQFEGFAPKDISIDLLKATIDKVMAGQSVFNINAETIPVAEIPELKSDSNTLKLSPRQLEIVDLIKKGTTTNKEIATTLSLSVFTVETHLKNIFQLAKVRNKLELISASI